MQAFGEDPEKKKQVEDELAQIKAKIESDRLEYEQRLQVEQKALEEAKLKLEQDLKEREETLKLKLEEEIKNSASKDELNQLQQMLKEQQEIAE